MSNLQVRAFLQPPMEGVVIQTYGAGKILSLKQISKCFLENISPFSDTDALDFW